jgi:hypothetical protein
MVSAPQNVTRIAPIISPAPPACSQQRDQTRHRGHGSDQERHACSNSEAASRYQRSLNRTRTESLGDAEFVAGMRAYRVMDHQLVGDLFRERRIESASDVDCHQFLVFALVVCFLFGALKFEFGLFSVRL